MISPNPELSQPGAMCPRPIGRRVRRRHRLCRPHQIAPGQNCCNKAELTKGQPFGSMNCLMGFQSDTVIGMIALAGMSAKAIYGPESKDESELP